ncbi:ATP-binding protein [Desulfotomaculum copahuensis]|uniref:(4Fe-4S)-binding protein n=1 Tax=Desulfotomaculum copahuensis TaxID=1838280 RepID=A0A1B7LB31_9FIRM|nr:ATP-binding protein [Desulfotomaculum copahuensis]OAT79523.1 (4Fe-4S)-binding protein [Desulfotomaculum copahuensis]
MRELVVLSGKGGTGKTSICGSLAVLAANKVLADCDVDAANLHLLLEPEIKSSSPFYGLPKAQINDDLCLACDLCAHLCRFNAIRGQRVLTGNCEGCGVCYHACPCEAVEMLPHIAGELHLSKTRYGPLVHANLGVAEDNSGKLVAAVRKKARQVAEAEKKELIITDGPPGVGCPVISCLSGIDLVLVVTEPTLSGMHDMERMLDLADFFNVKAVVCINKWDLHPGNTESIEASCRRRDVPVPVRLPYDQIVKEAACRAQPVVQYGSGPVVDGIVALWDELRTRLV